MSVADDAVRSIPRAEGDWFKDCSVCRAFDEYQACSLGPGERCELGWHWRPLKSGFGYETEEAFERCSLSSRLRSAYLRHESERREKEQIEALAERLRQEERVARRAEELARRPR